MSCSRKFFIHWMLFALLTFIVSGFLSWLGLWQLHRADEKRVMIAHFNVMQNATPLVLEGDGTGIKNYQPIRIKGVYDNEHVFLLDNQFYQHQLGYEVVQPMTLSNNRIILVSRGWIKAPSDRLLVPEMTFPSENETTILGTAYFPSKSLMVLGNNEDSFGPNQHWPKRIETLNISEIQHWLHSFCKKTTKKGMLYPFILRLSASEPDGFVRDWKIVSMPPERHTGYAVQWFGMAIVVWIIFIVLSYKKYQSKRRKKI